MKEALKRKEFQKAQNLHCVVEKPFSHSLVMWCYMISHQDLSQHSSLLLFPPATLMSTTIHHSKFKDQQHTTTVGNKLWYVWELEKLQVL
ncbi:hypothetical protein Pcinc_029438 [Petrolisthes cinctipes]|uniref:Uncharacterized protein n=1 Tax=Petrolisthes cinctipes TaxID=88211 RepID=A0AAE1K5V8_PETCI|nr:hypothetical protein Pcinc_029438 [Petrolisthes cinctipes]